MHKGLWLAALMLATGGRGEAQSGIELFPGSRIFPVFRADALAHQLSLSRVTDNREWIGVVGGHIPLIQVGAGEITAQMGLGASVFNRIIKTPGHITVYTVDYRVDIPFDFGFPQFTLRVGYGHISNHYADDGIEILGSRSINAVKDYVQAAVARNVTLIGGEVYAGIVWNYHAEPIADRRWMVQIGTNFGNHPLASWVSLYGAVDVKVKQEVNWGTTQSYQIGFMTSPKGDRALRLAYTFRTGFEERGQLYDRSVTANLVSLYIDF